VSLGTPVAPPGPEADGPSNVSPYVEATAAPVASAPTPTAEPTAPPSRLGIASTVLTVVGIVALSFAVFAIWGTAVLQQRDQNALRADLAERFVVDRATAESGGEAEGAVIEGGFGTEPEAGSESEDEGNAPEELGPVSTGDAMALIRIPAIGVDQVVVEGSGAQQLRSAPGHLRGSPRPGQKGNVVIAGKRTTYAGPFSDLDQLKAGNRIELGTASGTYRYVVERVDTLTPEKDEDVIAGSEENRLTLVTADPPYRAVERLVVVARFDGEADGAPLRTVPVGLEPGPDELGLGRDANALPSVMLFIVLIVLSVIGFVWVRRRWTTWALWAVFVPIWLAGGVMLFENMLRWFPATL
jgi:sortase A